MHQLASMLADLEIDPPIEAAFAPHAQPRGLREQLGDAIGKLWAPAIATISRARHARMFHPEGVTLVGHVSPCDPGGRVGDLAARFSGRVLVRCSAALWRGGREHLDVLGFAVRVRRGDGFALDEIAHSGDQDLLFATIRSPFTMVLSPLFTDASDFVSNRYWAVSPFAAVGSRYELRLSPIEGKRRAAGPRSSRLLAAVRAKHAGWWLEARETWTLRWHRLAQIDLDRQAVIDQAALQFDPFRTGLGLEPVGLVHAIRRAAYPASRAARPH